MRRKTLRVDCAAAVLLAALVIILAPGLAVVAILAIFVLLVCAVSLIVGARRARQGRALRSTRRQPARTSYAVRSNSTPTGKSPRDWR